MLIDVGTCESSITREEIEQRKINVNEKYAKIEKSDIEDSDIDEVAGGFSYGCTKYLDELYRWGGKTR